jgi:hypothetical protein
MRLSHKLTSVAATALLFCTGYSQPATTLVVTSNQAKVVEAKNLGPAASFNQLMAELAEGNVGATWNAVPASWQNELNDLLRLVGEKMPAATWDKSFGLIKRIGKVLDSKSELFAGMLAAQLGPDQSKEEVVSSLKSFGKVLILLGESDLATVAKLKQVDLGAVADTTGSKLFKMILNNELLNSQIAEESEGEIKSLKAGILATKAELISTEGETAKIKITSPEGKVEEEDVVKVDGKWVLKGMADDYAKSFATAKEDLAKALDEMPKNQMQVGMVMGMLDGVIGSFEKAQSPEDIQQAIAGLGPMAGMFMGAAMSGGLGGGSSEAPAAEEVQTVK